jgi:hypothetical protein
VIASHLLLSLPGGSRARLTGRRVPSVPGATNAGAFTYPGSACRRATDHQSQMHHLAGAFGPVALAATRWSGLPCAASRTAQGGGLSFDRRRVALRHGAGRLRDAAGRFLTPLALRLRSTSRACCQTPIDARAHDAGRGGVAPGFLSMAVGARG